MYGFLLLSAFNRLPLRLPTRHLAGRKHKPGDSSTSSVTFADVAGVDEAKEELQEIVVGCVCCWNCSVVVYFTVAWACAGEVPGELAAAAFGNLAGA